MLLFPVCRRGNGRTHHHNSYRGVCPVLGPTPALGSETALGSHYRNLLLALSNPCRVFGGSPCHPRPALQGCRWPLHSRSPLLATGRVPGLLDQQMQSGDRPCALVGILPRMPSATWTFRALIGHMGEGMVRLARFHTSVTHDHSHCNMIQTESFPYKGAVLSTVLPGV